MSKADIYLNLNEMYKKIGLYASQNGESTAAHEAFELSDKYLKLADKEINGKEEQINNTRKMIAVLKNISEPNRQIAVALTTAYMDGVEAGMRFTKQGA